ncbi:hypothetical protein ACK6D9_10655 [Hoeflea sp. Naph1]|uniref:hypothetical protein n=1 Tax=Hoeflea sp. Naph1 TaxID=3388653 RepID=UPI00398FBF24
MKNMIWLFMLPGDLVRSKRCLSVKQDGRLIRSSINMGFWGVITQMITPRHV